MQQLRFSIPELDGKPCTKCGVVKHLDEFALRSDSGKRRGECKACQKVQKAEYHLANKEAYNERSRQNYAANRETRLQQEAERYATDPDYRERKKAVSNAWYAQNREYALARDKARIANDPELRARRNQVASERYFSNHEENKASRRQFWSENKERLNRKQAEYYATNKDAFNAKVAAYQKANPLVRLSRYFGKGNGKTGYEGLLAAQGVKCAICGTADPGGRGRFHVDHCHGCGSDDAGKPIGNPDSVRGLLCHNCNNGNPWDTIPGWGALADAYLARHSCPTPAVKAIAVGSVLPPDFSGSYGPYRRHRLGKFFGRRKGQAGYERLWSEQHGRCAICQTTEFGAFYKQFTLDHCHACGDDTNGEPCGNPASVRGLLCNGCNTGNNWSTVPGWGALADAYLVKHHCIPTEAV